MKTLLVTIIVVLSICNAQGQVDSTAKIYHYSINGEKGASVECFLKLEKNLADLIVVRWAGEVRDGAYNRVKKEYQSQPILGAYDESTGEIWVDNLGVEHWSYRLEKNKTLLVMWMEEKKESKTFKLVKVSEFKP